MNHKGLSLNKSHLNQHENIAAPLSDAITMPVEINGLDTGIVLYVGRSPFYSAKIAATPNEILQIAKALVIRES